MAHLQTEILKGEPDDQRNFRRHHVQLTVLVKMIADNEFEEGVSDRLKAQQRTAVTQEVSMTGLSFNSGVEYPIGALVDIQLQLATQMYELKAIVRRSYQLKLPGRKSYGCGVQFLKSENIAIVIPAIAGYLLHRHASKKAA